MLKRRNLEDILINTPPWHWHNLICVQRWKWAFNFESSTEIKCCIDDPLCTQPHRQEDTASLLLDTYCAQEDEQVTGIKEFNSDDISDVRRSFITGFIKVQMTIYFYWSTNC